MGLALPSQVIALLTFPGVVMHEVVEQFFCRRLGVAILDVCYFRFGNPAGYVTPEPNLHWRKLLGITLGPFFVNSLLGVLVAFPAVLMAWAFHVSSTPGYVLAWLGVSISAHAIPNVDHAQALWRALRGPQCPPLARLLATPPAGLTLIVSSGRAIGLDLLYGVAIVVALPALLLLLLH
jgi:hypothetical protein